MQQQQQQNDPNFKFCSFCKGDTKRRDNLRFTHWLMDKDTKQVTCPFLLTTICQVCYDRGHTSRNCPNRFRIDEMRLEAMSMVCSGSSDCSGADGSSNENECMRAHQCKLAQMRLEDELMRQRFARTYLMEPKHCAFCANGRYGDDFHKTHNLDWCPRLMCMICKECGGQGHTHAKCPLKQAREQGLVNDRADGEFVMDFDLAETQDSEMV